MIWFLPKWFAMMCGYFMADLWKKWKMINQKINSCLLSQTTIPVEKIFNFLGLLSHLSHPNRSLKRASSALCWLPASSLLVASWQFSNRLRTLMLNVLSDLVMISPNHNPNQDDTSETQDIQRTMVWKDQLLWNFLNCNCNCNCNVM